MERGADVRQCSCCPCCLHSEPAAWHGLPLGQCSDGEETCAVEKSPGCSFIPPALGWSALWWEHAPQAGLCLPGMPRNIDSTLPNLASPVAHPIPPQWSPWSSSKQSRGDGHLLLPFQEGCSGDEPCCAAGEAEVAGKHDEEALQLAACLHWNPPAWSTAVLLAQVQSRRVPSISPEMQEC